MPVLCPLPPHPGRTGFVQRIRPCFRSNGVNIGCGRRRRAHLVGHRSTLRRSRGPMKSMKLAVLFGAFLFSTGVGCGAVDSTSATASDITNVASNDVAGEQVANADGSGMGAMDHAGPCGRS